MGQSYHLASRLATMNEHIGPWWFVHGDTDTTDSDSKKMITYCTNRKRKDMVDGSCGLDPVNPFDSSRTAI